MVKKLLYLIVLSSSLLTGCKTLYSNRMLETPKDFKFDALPMIDTKEEFKLSSNDEFTFKLFSNDGYKLVDMNINSNNAGIQGAKSSTYTIKNDGFAKLPLLGLVKLSGLTIAEAEDTLQNRFSEFYIKPFVLLNISNRKIIFFASGEGNAQIVSIQGNSISLIEAIAQAGGIPKFGRAYSIKIFRGEVKNPLVYKVDLSTLDGYKIVDMNINSANAGVQGVKSSTYTIKNDGFIKLPLLGLVKLSGLTIAEAEDTLQNRFSEFYIKPFVLLNVSNRKIIFFASGEGSAKLVPIQGNTISLIEAIAQAGGIPKFGRAYSIKIFRGESKNPLVYKVDLSTLDGYKVGNIVLQSNDIVYIDARQGLARNLTQEIAPYLGLLTSLLLTVFYFSRVRNV